MTVYEQAQAKLRELAAKVEAGTPGPWVSLGNYLAHFVDSCTCGGAGGVYGHEGGCGMEDIGTAADAPLIVTAVNHLPGFVALCESVLERHRPIPCDDADCATEPHDSCLADGHDYPCPDARAVLTALGVLDRLGTAEGESR